MQPYFFPYIGYWQLLARVDQFVLYDNIQYTKKGWINRNRFLQNGKDQMFTIPLKKDSEFLDVVQRFLADDFNPDKLLNQFEGSYREAPYFKTVFPLIATIVKAQDKNLFLYIHHSIQVVADFLNIRTPIVISSTIPIDHSLKSESKVLALCKAMGASTYVNPIGGQDLYSKSTFEEQGLALQFIKMRPVCYQQTTDLFVANLSIIDVMMFNSRENIMAMLTEYDFL